MSKSIFEALGSDADKETNGITVVWFNGSVEIKIRLARAGGANVAFNKAWERETRSMRRSGVDMARLDLKEQHALIRRVYISTVILGWEGVFDENEQEIPYTRENAEYVLQRLPSLLDF